MNTKGSSESSSLPGRTEVTNPNLSGLRMFVAEDDQYCFEYLKQLFRRTGIDIVHAKNGVHLMTLLDTHVPDLILLDVHMPEKDGYECLQEIRNQRIVTKVIVQTANDIRDDFEKVMRAGADGYISKPIHKNELFKLVNKVLNRENPQTALE